MSKHKHYEILNLLGYGLAKFDMDFVREFGFYTKTAFYDYCINLGIADTRGTISNRMDLFDPFFDNRRKGWWQKAELYRHRKDLIDGLFGNENVHSFAEIVKLYLQENKFTEGLILIDKPIIKSRFKRLQETGLEAELYFMNHYGEQILFKNGILEDARLYGDGYDFQITVGERNYLSEVKGIRSKKGTFRLTEKEYQQAEIYKESYVVSVVSNLDYSPNILLIDNPLKHLEFKKVVRKIRPVVEYHLIDII